MPTEEDLFWFDGLTAGEDYLFYLQTESNGLSSDTYEVNQPTYPANTGDAFEVSTARQQDQVVFSVAFEPGTGSKVVFSCIGETSGGTHSEEKEYMLVLFQPRLFSDYQCLVLFVPTFRRKEQNT